MMIAHWQIDTRFGHKQTVIDAVRRWCEEIGTQIGWTADRTRIATGSVGALEATVELEVHVEDLAELNASWGKLGTVEAHAAWGKEIEPSVVSGTSRWQVYRLV